jgi:hypothetical protein
MSRQTALVLLLLGAGALAFAVASPFSPFGGAKAPPSGAGDAVWRSGYPLGHVHLCKPEDITGGPVPGPHPLYARPHCAGHNRTCLIDNGWSWIINPPGEDELL